MANSKRIEFLAQCLDGYHKVLDIGTDHGLVLKIALDNHYIENAIASDINDKPLKQAKKNLLGYPVEFIKSNGFENILEAVDLTLIAGMGVYTMMDILKQPHTSSAYLLQPNNKYYLLRKFLADNNFKIIDEYVVFDKFYYVVIKAVKGTMQLSLEDLLLGPVLKHKAEAIPYYQFRKNLLVTIAKKANKEKKLEIDNMIAIYDRVLNNEL